MSKDKSPPPAGIFYSIKNFFKSNLLAGILVLTPVVATVFFMTVLLTWVDKILLLIPPPYRPENFLPFPVPGLGFILLFVVLLLAGFVVRNILGKQLVRLGEKIVSYIPFVRSLYYGIKQLTDTILSGSGRDFKRVVLIEYPRRGIYALAFVTGMSRGEIQNKTPQRCINVFLPTTPNPTSGFYLVVPEEDAIPLELTVEESFKILMSGGILGSDTVQEAIEERQGAEGATRFKEETK